MHNSVIIPFYKKISCGDSEPILYKSILYNRKGMCVLIGILFDKVLKVCKYRRHHPLMARGRFRGQKQQVEHCSLKIHPIKVMSHVQTPLPSILEKLLHLIVKNAVKNNLSKLKQLLEKGQVTLPDRRNTSVQENNIFN